MMLDPFKDGFTLAELSQSINILPNMYGRVNELGLFTWRPQHTQSVILEMKDNVLTLVPTTPWGGVAPKSESGHRKLRSFVIPHMPLEGLVKASDVMGVRSFGTDSVDPLTAKVNEELQTIKNKFDITLEYRKMTALKGIVLDADGTTELYDYFEEFAITKKSVNFALGTPTTDVRGKCMEVVRHMEDNLKGDRMQRAHVLVSPEFFDAFVSHAKVKEAFANYAEAAQRLGGDMRKGFSFGGLTFEEYRGSVGSQRFIDSGKGHAFPVGSFETFSNFGAPADFNETVNTIALPMYVKQKTEHFDRGIELHGQANQLPMVSRPATIVECVAN